MLTLREKVRRFAALSLVVAGAACSTDQGPTGLTPASADLAAQTAAAGKKEKTISMEGASTQAASVRSVGWLGSQTKDTYATKVIGPEGGGIHIKELGFQLIVPPNAVSEPTTFSVRALSGRAVAYEFEPHGMKFNVPLIFRQEWTYTNFGLGKIPMGGYFPDETSLNTQTGEATVVEQIPAKVVGTWIEFLITHFSGYLVSCA